MERKVQVRSLMSCCGDSYDAFVEEVNTGDAVGDEVRGQSPSGCLGGCEF